MNKNLVLGIFETPHTELKAIGKSKEHCRTLLYQAWNKYCKRSGADPKYILEYDNDIYFLNVSLGEVYLDNELVYKE